MTDDVSCVPEHPGGPVFRGERDLPFVREQRILQSQASELILPCYHWAEQNTVHAGHIQVNAGPIRYQPVRKEVQTGKLAHSAEPLDRVRFSLQTDYAS